MQNDNHLPQTGVMQFRMGVHMGDVIADEDEVFGDGVNVRVRIEAIASPAACRSAKAYHEAASTHAPLVDAGSHRLRTSKSRCMSGPGSRAGPTRAVGNPGTHRICRRNTERDRGRAAFSNLSDSTDEYFFRRAHRGT